ncbi:hypothetical protein BGX38DRAFT_1228911 [Terfezia claveryi]|nr:hypothetical protein BGX38DRAFT_1228911 [Terfezia claveryi]
MEWAFQLFNSLSQVMQLLPVLIQLFNSLSQVMQLLPVLCWSGFWFRNRDDNMDVFLLGKTIPAKNVPNFLHRIQHSDAIQVNIVEVPWLIPFLELEMMGSEVIHFRRASCLDEFFELTNCIPAINPNWKWYHILPTVNDTEQGNAFRYRLWCMGGYSGRRAVEMVVRW